MLHQWRNAFPAFPLTSPSALDTVMLAETFPLHSGLDQTSVPGFALVFNADPDPEPDPNLFYACAVLRQSFYVFFSLFYSMCNFLFSGALLAGYVHQGR